MIFTIGYGNRHIDTFLEILKRHDIAYLGDVRTYPKSGYNPDFNQHDLRVKLNSTGIQYLFMGHQLGGNPEDDSVRVDTSRRIEGVYLVDYQRQMNTPVFQDGLRRLIKAQQLDLNIVLMCSEARPEECHRTRLIGEALRQQGIIAYHIDENDEDKSQEDVMLRLTKGQPSLPGFGPPARSMVSSRGWRIQESSGDYKVEE